MSPSICPHPLSCMLASGTYEGLSPEQESTAVSGKVLLSLKRRIAKIAEIKQGKRSLSLSLF